MKELLIWVIILTSIGVVSAGTTYLEEGVLIQVNPADTGHYIINNSIYIDTMTVNETNVTITDLDASNQTVKDINTQEIICSGSSTCILSRVTIVKNIRFGVANYPPTTPVVTNLTNGSTYYEQKIIPLVSSHDIDNDTITFYHFVNDVLNATATTNVTLNISYGGWFYNVMAYDGTDYSSNSSVYNFTLSEELLTGLINVTLTPGIEWIKISWALVNHSNFTVI